MIKDDESQNSRTSKASKNQENSSSNQYQSRLQQISLSQPKASNLLLARMHTKLKIDTMAAKTNQIEPLIRP